MWAVYAMTQYAEVISQDGAKIEEVVNGGLSEEKLLAGPHTSDYDEHNFVNASLALIFRQKIKTAMEEQQT